MHLLNIKKKLFVLFGILESIVKENITFMLLFSVKPFFLHPSYSSNPCVGLVIPYWLLPTMGLVMETITFSARLEILCWKGFCK